MGEKVKMVYYFNVNNQNFHPFCADPEVEVKNKTYLRDLVVTIQSNNHNVNKFIIESYNCNQILCLDADNECNVLTGVTFTNHIEKSIEISPSMNSRPHRYVHLDINKYSLDPTKTGHIMAILEHFRRYYSRNFDYILVTCPISPSLLCSLIRHGFVMNTLSEEFERLFCLSIELSNKEKDMELNKHVSIDSHELDVYKRKFSEKQMSEHEATVIRGYPHSSVLLYYVFNDELYDSEEK
jgi:hypothetical protein